ncbi:Rv3235 family protein [Streptomyces sp. NBC_00009]|uniref:Rv3235 family protein n=1 Tax=Streptomyces sp. NBC_00009 TaxID=2975620 RepID=UPI003254589F
MHEPTAHEPLRKVMDQPRRRPRTTRPPGGRPPGRQDARRPGARPVRVPPQLPPHPAELFTERLLLMLSGQRPVHWASRHFAGSLYDALIRLAENRPLNDRGRQPVVRGIGHYQPEPGVYEVFARISAGPRLHALAFRLHRGDDHRWLCTAVEMVGRPPRGTGA